MVMVPDRARNQERLCWTQPLALYWNELEYTCNKRGIVGRVVFQAVRVVSRKVDDQLFPESVVYVWRLYFSKVNLKALGNEPTLAVN
jgi:hypothetical protein